VLADNVNYGVSAPWPATLNGTGASLQRKNDAAFGDDPASWIASDPTPGFGYSPEAPIALNIELNGSNVMMTWPDTSGIWTLEQSDGMVAPVVWQPVAVLPVKENGSWRAVVPVSNQANRYYRLKTQ
jgi:hypothetical protein